MKKISVILLAVSLLAVSAGCKKQQTAGATGATFELALVTDLGTIDDKSFNQGAWEGLVQYAKEKNITHKYYQPAEQSDDSYLTTIDLAVKGGAKIVVTPGFLFEVPIFVAQDRYPNVNFILVDGAPHNADYSVFKTGPNTVGVLYAEDQAGFLAGYAAVKDGNKSLGFVGGMAVPAVVRFGYGFIQGAEYAANELKLAPGSVTVNYHYTGAFVASPEAQTLAASWYNQGADVIFACGGAVGNSVMAAAEQAGKKVIGVDVDQAGESRTVITSAMKGLQASVYACISDYYNGKFPGGKTQVFEAANNGVGLPMATSKFQSFKQADYDAIFKDLASGKIPRMDNLDSEGSPKVVPVTIVKVTEVK
jgi:basic membrane protein A